MKLFLTLWAVAAVFSSFSTLAMEPFSDPVVFQRERLEEDGDRVLAGKLWVMEADGSRLRQLTFGRTYDEHASFFSDQRHVLYAEFLSNGFVIEAGARLVKMDIYSGERQIVAEEKGCALHHATVSPIGDGVAYHRQCGGRRSLRVGLGPEAYESPFDCFNAVQSPDGLVAMYEKNRDYSPREVGLVLARGKGAGASLTLLTDTTVLHRRPAISPDGEWLAWQTNAEGGEDEIYLSRMDGSQARNITNSSGNDGHPWFSRDGEWIVFESDRSGSWEIFRLRLATGGAERLTWGGGLYQSTRPRM